MEASTSAPVPHNSICAAQRASIASTRAIAVLQREVLRDAAARAIGQVNSVNDTRLDGARAPGRKAHLAWWVLRSDFQRTVNRGSQSAVSTAAWCAELFGGGRDVA